MKNYTTMIFGIGFALGTVVGWLFSPEGVNQTRRAQGYLEQLNAVQATLEMSKTNRKDLEKQNDELQDMVRRCMKMVDEARDETDKAIRNR